MEMAMSWLLVLVLACLVIGIVVVVAVLCSRKNRAEVSGEGSYFDGNTFQLIGYKILVGLVTSVTFGIAYPWMMCMLKRWEVKHTVINGRRLKFTGRGHQLIGKYLLWLFLTVITLGIYSIWLGLGMKKWIVKHTVYADEKEPVESYFSGGAGGYLGIHLLSGVLSVVTLGIGRAWAKRMVLSWEMKHTHIGGSPMVFNGTGGQLFGKYVLLVILSLLTLGIYSLFFTVIFLKWKVKHTEALYQTEKIQGKARAHEATAVQDQLRYHIAALEYGAKPAELSNEMPHEQRISTLSYSARCGNSEASYLLAKEHQKAGELSDAAYWYKVALQWGVPEANAEEYEAIIKALALQYAESSFLPKQSPAVAIILGVAGAVVLSTGLMIALLLLGAKAEMQPSENHTQEVVEGWNVQSVSLVQSIPSDQIRGEELDALDYLGNPLHYVFDQNVFFDYEKKQLYFAFGVIEYDFPICLTDKVAWQTEPITGSGVLMASYPYDMPPEKLAVMGETFISSDDTVNVISGTSAEAEIWIQEQCRIEEPSTEAPTEEPSTEPAVMEELLWGDWRRYEYIQGDNVYMTEFGWSFYSDGSCASYSSEYEKLSEEGKPYASYINGEYWLTIGGGGQNSSYYLEGDTLHITTEASVQYSEVMHYTYRIVALTEDTLELADDLNGLQWVYTRVR